MKSVGNLRACRRRVGLTQVKAAAELKVNQTAISQWEKGITRPSADKLPLLAKLYSCSIDDLFKEQEKT